jgi:hypothetical protein
MYRFLLKTFLNLRLHAFVGIMIIRSVEELDSIPSRGKDKNAIKVRLLKGFHTGEPSIILFNKTGLLEDLNAIREHASLNDVEFPKVFIIPRYVINLIAEHFLSEDQRYDFHLPTELEVADFRKLELFWKDILMQLKSKWNCRMIISANYTYGNERDAQKAGVEIGLKVVILYKECFMSVRHSEDLISVLKKSRRFHGTRMLLYNHGEMERQLSSGMATRSQLVVTGSPRFDAFLRGATKVVSINKAKIVFFVHDFATEANKGKFSDDQDAFDVYSNKAISFGLELMNKAARNFPEISFEIKIKITKSTQEFVDIWTRKVVFPPNISLAKGGLAQDSLKNCIGALGFNTTALVDAMASGIPVAVLNLVDAQDKFEGYKINFGPGSTEVSSYLEFQNWIHLILTEKDAFGNINQSISMANNQFLLEAIGNNDGGSSRRALSEILLEFMEHE